VCMYMCDFCTCVYAYVFMYMYVVERNRSFLSIMSIYNDVYFNLLLLSVFRHCITPLKCLCVEIGVLSNYQVSSSSVWGLNRAFFHYLRPVETT
jgi:hypothetical protein